MMSCFFEGKFSVSDPQKKHIENFGGAGRSGKAIGFYARRSRLLVSGILQIFDR